MRRDSRISLYAVQLFAVFLAACGSSKNSGSSGPDGGLASSPSGPGNFSSVWQAASVEVSLYDTSNPTAAPPTQTVELPALTKEPTTGTNIELYVTFEGDKRVSYARYENTNAYYRITESATHAGSGSSEMYSMMSSSSIYTLDDGLLKLTTTRQVDTKISITRTMFRKIDFPPAGWPTEKIDYQAGDPQ